MTKNTGIYLLAVSLLVLIGFAIALARIPYASPSPGPVQDNMQHNPQTSSITIALEHQYQAGANMFRGSLTTPTPCDQIEVGARIAAEEKEKITLLLSTETDPDEVCAQVLAEKGFTAVVPSSLGAELVAVMLNGERVNFDLEAGQN